MEKKIVALKDGVKTLDNIEHDILRPEYKDPRIHFAVNCASKGCPPLLNEPFTGKAVDGQLERLTIRFINDPKRTRLEGSTLFLNPIFKWYSEDFGNPVEFVKKYAEPDLSAKLEKAGNRLDVDYYDYDWSLNGK